MRRPLATGPRQQLVQIRSTGVSTFLQSATKQSGRLGDADDLADSSDNSADLSASQKLPPRSAVSVAPVSRGSDVIAALK